MIESFSLRVHSGRSACFVFVFFPLLFRLMVGREALGAYVGGLGPLLGPMLAVWGRSWGLCWRSWAALGPMLAVLGRSWDLCWRSWATLGAYVGGLGSGSGPKLAVLGGLRAKVVGLGRGSGRKVAQTRAGRPFRGGDGNRVRTGPRVPVRFFFL